MEEQEEEEEQVPTKKIKKEKTKRNTSHKDWKNEGSLEYYISANNSNKIAGFDLDGNLSLLLNENFITLN